MRRAAVSSAEDAVQGVGSLTILTGEAGIGKTSVARALARFARDEMTVSWGLSAANRSAPAFWPWRDLLDDEELIESPDVEESVFGAVGAQRHEALRKLPARRRPCPPAAIAPHHRGPPVGRCCVDVASRRDGDSGHRCALDGRCHAANRRADPTSSRRSHRGRSSFGASHRGPGAERGRHRGTPRVGRSWRRSGAADPHSKQDRWQPLPRHGAAPVGDDGS